MTDDLKILNVRETRTAAGTNLVIDYVVNGGTPKQHIGTYASVQDMRGQFRAATAKEILGHNFNLLQLSSEFGVTMDVLENAIIESFKT